MKKPIIISALIYLSLLTRVNGQDSIRVVDSPNKFHVVEFGLRFMPTFSTFNIETSSGGAIIGEVTLGYGVGGLLGINFTNHVGIQAEVIYNSLSQKYKDQGFNREINIRYINVPLLLSLNTGKSRAVNFNIVLGPQFGLNVGSNIEKSNGTTNDSLATVLVIKKGDFGFAYGAGLGFMLNSSRSFRLDLGFRGVYGFVNINDTDPSRGTNTIDILNQAKVRTNSAYIGFTILF